MDHFDFTVVNVEFSTQFRLEIRLKLNEEFIWIVNLLW